MPPCFAASAKLQAVTNQRWVKKLQAAQSAANQTPRRPIRTSESEPICLDSDDEDDTQSVSSSHSNVVNIQPITIEPTGSEPINIEPTSLDDPMGDELPSTNNLVAGNAIPFVATNQQTINIAGLGTVTIPVGAGIPVPGLALPQPTSPSSSNEDVPKTAAAAANGNSFRHRPTRRVRYKFSEQQVRLILSRFVRA